MRKVVTAFGIFVLIPTLIASIYYFLIASPQWVSESKFAIKGAQASNHPELLGFILGQQGNMASDSLFLHEFVLSKDMVDALEERIKLRDMFTDRSIDFIARLSNGVTKEEFVEFFANQVSIVFDTSSGVSTLRVRAFKPQDAKVIADAILELSEALVNQISKRAQADALALAKDELGQAEERLMIARASTKSFRNERGAINPVATGESLMGIIASLEGQLAQANAEIAQAKTYMRDSNPAMIALKTKTAAIQEQIGAAKSRLTGNGGSVVSELVEGYQRYVMEEEFARKRYEAALSAYETARIQAISKSRYLVAIVNPSLPERHDVFRGIRGVAKVFGSCLLGFVLISMIVAAIREHVGFALGGNSQKRA